MKQEIDGLGLRGDVKCETSGARSHIGRVKGSSYGWISRASIIPKGSNGEADLKISGG